MSYRGYRMNGVDITMTGVGFMGPAGSIVSTAYFIGTSIYDKN